MTKLLDLALETVRRLPPVDQDKIARAMLCLAGHEPAEETDPEHLADVIEGVAQARVGELATEAEVEAVFRQLDP
jgi:hypothetical protein